jgi:hypothetical protein
MVFAPGTPKRKPGANLSPSFRYTDHMRTSLGTLIITTGLYVLGAANVIIGVALITRKVLTK